ncbi:MAG: hypothetical protein K8R54_09975 [Bacteroidales bacterium]|nr:hypothetical protein [Bacteroidales bacterium]
MKNKIFTTRNLFRLIFIALFITAININNAAAQAVSINTTGNAPDASAMLDIVSTSSGILIPRMTEAERGTIDVTGSPTGVMVYQTDGAVPGYYYYDGTEWQNLFSGDIPVIPGESEYWLRPDADPTYIYPEGNTMIKVYDAGETYGIHYDGGTNQYGIWARTTDVTNPTAAVAGFSDVAGNQTTGYLGYNGNWTATAPATTFGTVSGSGAYAIAEDPGRTAVFGRSTGNATFAATISYSDVWMANYNYVDNSSDTYNPSTVYAQLNNTDVTLAGDHKAYTGVSVYEGATDGAGTTMGAYFQGWGYNNAGTAGQPAVGVTGEGLGTISGLYDYAAGVRASSNSPGTIYAHPNGLGAAVEGTGRYGGAYFDLLYDAGPGVGYYLGETWNGLVADAWPANGSMNSDMWFFGVHGALFNVDANSRINRRSGGVLGSHEDGGAQNAWGSLGYHANNNSYYGVYGSTPYASGGGKNKVYNGTGVAGSGSLFGAWFNGETYGMAVKGERFGLYVSGKQYTNEVITQLNDNGTNERIATYVPTSMTVDIYMKGTGQLENGKATINFDKEYINLISDSEPVIVTVTPMGQTNGVYLESVKSTGFSIAENNAGKSNTSFSWIAVATRRGYENPENPKEVLSYDYDKNLSDHMFNDSDLENEGKPMWFDGEKINFTEVPNVVRMDNKKERKIRVDSKIKIIEEDIKVNNEILKQSFKKTKVIK